MHMLSAHKLEHLLLMKYGYRIGSLKAVVNTNYSIALIKQLKVTRDL